ncbi:MAG: YkgJ family cysteine cluster protein [Acidobacteriota bacterium]|nr:YkgJ family cysteine cluster protein [Acidobacteriota bacterium]
MHQTLVQIVDSAVADAYRRGGPHLACRPGCSQCCIGVFPIALEDAARLREGLLALDPADSSKAARIRQRVAHSLARLAPWFPGDPATGILNEDHEAAILFEEFANDEPCPVLDPVTGTCDLYRHRPILCRTFGPPMRTPGDDGEVNLATCELCFIQASTEEIPPANSTLPCPPGSNRATKPSTPHRAFAARPSSPTPCAARER